MKINNYIYTSGLVLGLFFILFIKEGFIITFGVLCALSSLLGFLIDFRGRKKIVSIKKKITN